MKKRRKFGIGLKIASILTTVAVVSVGLASWIITVPTQATDVSGSIQVETVRTDRVTLAGTWVNVTEESSTIAPGADAEAPVMYYGAPSETISGAWLTNSNTEKENLVAWLKVTATVEGEASVADLKVTFTASNATKFDGAIGASIGAPEFTVWKETITQNGETTTTSYTKGTPAEYSATKLDIPLAGSTGSTTGSATTYNYYVKVEFKWGTAFGRQNAYEYFNNQEYTEPLATEASGALGDLYDALNGVTYKMTIDA